MKANALFLSYVSLLGALKRGTTAAEALAAGLFFFSCSRDRAFSRDSVQLAEMFSTDPDNGRRIHDMVVEALRSAEADNRVCWPNESGERTYSDLNRLLASNGLEQIPDQSAEDTARNNTIREQMHRVNPSVHVP